MKLTFLTEYLKMTTLEKYLGVNYSVTPVDPLVCVRGASLQLDIWEY